MIEVFKVTGTDGTACHGGNDHPVIEAVVIL